MQYPLHPSGGALYGIVFSDEFYELDSQKKV